MVKYLQAADEFRWTSTDVGTWTAVLIGIIAVSIAWLAYRSQRGRKGLEYIVLSIQRLVDPRVAQDLDVVFDGRPVDDPSLTVLRMVSTGDKGIPSETFESPLRVTLVGASRVVHASVSAKRPSDLPVALTTDSNHASIDPLLLNPGDFIEVLVLADGQPTRVALDARIADVTPKRRNSLPYPPGSGPEGQMIGQDRFFWFVLPFVLAVLAYFAIASADLRAVATIAWVVTVTLVFFVIYPMQVRRLVGRRRAWRPPASSDRLPKS
jgi:hypothetical protein